MRLGVVLLLLTVQAAPAQEPEPSPAAQKEAEKEIRELFKAQYAKRSPADQQALARKLLESGLETKDNPAGRYVLFREARDVAVQAGDVATALTSVDELAGAFVVDRLSLRSSVVSKVTVPRAPEAARALAEAGLAVLQEAVDADKYELAASAVAKAESAARAAQDPHFVSQIQARAKDVGELREQYARVRAAEATLSQKPDDGPSHAEVGRFVCFFKGDWEKGLPRLVSGSDPALRDLAQKDLGKPGAPEAKVQLADAWWDVSERERSRLAKSRLRGRAAFWYEQALPNLTGLVRLKVEKRIQEAQASPAQEPIELLKLVDPAKDSVRGDWRFQEGGLLSPTGPFVRLQIPYAPPAEYDLRVVVERKSAPEVLVLGLVLEGAQCTVGLDGLGGTQSTLEGAGDRVTAPGRALKNSGTSLIVCAVRKASLAVTVDGRKVFETALDPKRPGALPAGWDVPAKNALFLGAYDCSYRFTSVLLAPVSGSGKRLR